MDIDFSTMKGEDENSGHDKGASAGNHNHYSTNIMESVENRGKSRKSKSSSDRRMVDITRDKPIKVAVRVVVPVKDHPRFNFVGKLLGPKGNSLKRLQEDTMCKMAVLGRGSMRDRHKEEELRASGDPKFQHLSEELHVEISAFATPAEAHARIAYALAEVRRFLVPDYNDDIRQEQMWEMQVLSSQKPNGGGPGKEDLEGVSGQGMIPGSGCTESLPGSAPGSSVGSAAGGECPSTHSDDSMCGTTGINGGESPTLIGSGEHPALRGVQQVVVSSGSPPLATCPQTGLLTGVIPTTVNTTTSGTVVGNVAGRKRPLLAGASRATMTPTKRTVMSLLARARAAQAKQVVNTPFRPAEASDDESFDEDVIFPTAHNFGTLVEGRLPDRGGESKPYLTAEQS